MEDKAKKLEEAFIAAYDEYADAIFRHCYFKLSNKERAEELTEEAFVRAWQYVVDGQAIDNIRALLYRIANNLIIDEYRRKKTLSLDTLESEGFEVASDQSGKFIEEQAEITRVLEILDTLDPKYRDVVVMRYVDDLAVKEIAEILGESENTISVRINRAIKQLRTRLRT